MMVDFGVGAALSGYSPYFSKTEGRRNNWEFPFFKIKHHQHQRLYA
jgi:hypothetical protein